jgi:hypothetical protein
MKSKLLPLALGVVIAILLSLLPIYPLWVEGRQITQSGESLYHEWQFVSLIGYCDAHIYAQYAWQEITKSIYFVFAILNPVLLIFISVLLGRGASKLFGSIFRKS